MDESGEKFANLAPMRIRHDSVQSNVADCKYLYLYVNDIDL